MPDSIVDELINTTYRELSEVNKPLQRSRIWTSTNGYIFLIPWANACLLRTLVRIFSTRLPRSEYRLKAQVDDAARSVVANIEEGFARPTTSEYITFLGYSQASLKEVKGDIQRSLQDGFLVSHPGTSVAGLGINFTDWHEALRKSVISTPNATKILQPPLISSKGKHGNLEDCKGQIREDQSNDPPQPPSTSYKFPYNPTSQPPLKPFTFLYNPVDNLKSQDLTYEIFIELINKTDWHLRRLVESLENKLNRDQKFYQVEQARIRSKLRLK